MIRITTTGDTQKLNSILQKTENASGIIFQSKFTKNFMKLSLVKLRKTSKLSITE